MKKNKEQTTSINTRYPQEVLETMRRLAQRHERSLNGEIVWALRDYIQRKEAEEYHADESL